MALRILIAGGGISGLSLAYFLKDRKDFELTLVESAPKTGGKVWTEKEDGFILESGVNAFLNNKPRTLELAGMLGLAPLKSSDSARKRFILSRGRLVRLPESPPAFLMSPLISLPGKLRLMMEPFVSKGAFKDETLADFARRRLGKEAFEMLIDPMASGVFAGDPETMSLKSCFPRIHEIEQKYGSLIKGMIKLQIAARKTGGPKVSAAPGGVLTSFSGGMQEMTDALTNELRGSVKVDSRITGIEKAVKGYTVHLNDGTIIEADRVALAVPAYESAKVLSGLNRKFADILETIKYPPLAIVSLGYKKEKVNVPLDSFGFLVPKKEGRKILGTLYDSSIFPNRAPEEFILLRCMVGGAKTPELAMKDEGEILKTAASEVRDIVGIKTDPDFHRVFKHEKAIPQYEVGHSLKLERLEELLGGFPGLYLTGNSLNGVAMNDCIENSYKLATKIKEEN